MKTYNRIQDKALRTSFHRQLFTNDQLIYPLFVKEGSDIYEEIPSLPGQYHYSIDKLPIILKTLMEVGVFKILLFGLPKEKTLDASQASEEDSIINQAIKYIKNYNENFYIICDVCLCEYTTHGHCQLYNENQTVNLTKTLNQLSAIALSNAKAGADMLAPSDMQDSRIAHIRQILAENNFNLPLLSYSIKYASNYYGPFRQAANSAPQFGDRRSYQIEYESTVDILQRVQDDLRMGADIIMVKPALNYLDIIKDIKVKYNPLICAYHVSGEYVMIKNLENSASLSAEKILHEQLHALKRVGVDLLITYFAIEIAKDNNEQ